MIRYKILQAVDMAGGHMRHNNGRVYSQGQLACCQAKLP